MCLLKLIVVSYKGTKAPYSFATDWIWLESVDTKTSSISFDVIASSTDHAISGLPNAGMMFLFFIALEPALAGIIAWIRVGSIFNFYLWWSYLARRKIYYCRLVRLGLWETFHNKLSGNIIPRRLVGTLSELTFPCSQKICGRNKYCELKATSNSLKVTSSKSRL